MFPRVVTMTNDNNSEPNVGSTNKDSISAIFKCQYCEKRFEWKKSLLKHHRNKHGSVTIHPIKKFTCTFCNSEFTEKHHMKDHIDKFHCTNPQKMHMLLPCTICQFSNNSSEKLHQHYETDHKIQIIKESINFENKEQFLLWKENEQKRTYSRYIQHAGVKKNLNGGESLTYYCHRIGSYSLKTIRQRREREQGTKKTSRNCPSKIYVRISRSGSVNVDYISTHVGHKNELYHIHLTAIEKNNIAKKLAMNISDDDILTEIRSAVDFNSLKRMDLLTKKDLYNIKNYCKETSTLLQDAEKIPMDLAEEMENIMPIEHINDNISSDSLDAIDINPEGFQDLAQRCIDELVQSIQDNINMPEDLDIGNNIPNNHDIADKPEESFSVENLFNYQDGIKDSFLIENLPHENIEMSCTISLDSDFLNIRCDILQNL